MHLLVAKPILFLVLFTGGIVSTAVIALVIFAVLAGTGSPGEAAGVCRNDELDLEAPESPGLRNIITDPALAQQWQERWEAFRGQVDAGEEVGITFEESETTSRATRWIADEDVPLKRVTICFYDGEAEARASAKVPLISDIPLIGAAFDTELRVRGGIDLSGDHPRIDITKLEAGSLPGVASGLVEHDIESLLNDKLAELNLDRSFDVTFSETRAEITVR